MGGVMKFVRQSEYKIVNDDGTDLAPYEMQNINKLIDHIIEAKIIGVGESPFYTKSVALKMAQVMIDNYYLAPKNE
tara:strand:+ start:50 stop:277 length:228 start_codon:yes stop_codon:yes gene_type:complete